MQFYSKYMVNNIMQAQSEQKLFTVTLIIKIENN